MHEPIENLVANMDQLSRPFSSKQQIGAAPRIKNGSLKRERAMTAHNKHAYKTAVSGLLKIAQSAYHIDAGQHQKNTMSALNNWGNSGQYLYGNQQSIQVADGMVTLGGGSSIPANRVQSAYPNQPNTLQRVRGP